MGIFIGTRLHSVIFSLSVGTPSINIAYHGTKSQGILAGIRDLEKYVIDINTINEEILLDGIKDLLINKDKIKQDLTDDISTMKNTLEDAMKDIYLKCIILYLTGLETHNMLFQLRIVFSGHASQNSFLINSTHPLRHFYRQKEL